MARRSLCSAMFVFWILQGALQDAMAARHVQQEASSDIQASRSRQPGSDHSDVLYVCAAGRAIRAASVPGHALLLKNHAIVLKDFQVKA